MVPLSGDAEAPPPACRAGVERVVEPGRTALVSGIVRLFGPAPARAIWCPPSASPWSRADTACSSSEPSIWCRACRSPDTSSPWMPCWPGSTDTTSRSSTTSPMSRRIGPRPAWASSSSRRAASGDPCRSPQHGDEYHAQPGAADVCKTASIQCPPCVPGRRHKPGVASLALFATGAERRAGGRLTAALGDYRFAGIFATTNSGRRNGDAGGEAGAAQGIRGSSRRGRFRWRVGCSSQRTSLEARFFKKYPSQLMGEGRTQTSIVDRAFGRSLRWAG